ncbi:hypothetical protein BGZ80_003857 [Entomortierella chlamydospora]|uniref:t-SNARE coiled-coil homology domain-containing protein n=1 Tax=Entomortierella chlamydospora TaxID=101097 RepID=A0A9P6SWD6_9FUNG|nr:hypothetical protein BGZ79_002413 [Entomortierella chlamydospora]KAG0008092.1 hypothetical protein BGZ80_003857 [Entomortierella chlamydospora]
MSFTDLDRGLSSPPLSPNHRDENFGKKHGPTITTKITTTATSKKQGYSPMSPPIKLPSGLQVTSGNSRDSVGLNLQPQLSKNPQGIGYAHSPYPPPVSPNRKPNNPMAQHSRFLEDNTRFDTPRPTLTPSTAIAATGANSGEAAAATPRSPHTDNSGSSHGNGNNRILGNHRPGDQDRRQVLSPPNSPPQFTQSSNPFSGQYRGFIRADNQSPPDSGVSNDTVISIEVDAMRSSSTTTSSSAAIQRDITSGPVHSTSIQDQEHDYDLMVRHVSQQIFNISSNIAVLERLVPCLGQRRKDTPEVRASLHAVLDTTQDLVKSAHGLIKVLAKYHQPPANSPPSNIGLRAQTPLSSNEMSSWQRKVLASRRQTHQRLTKDLSLASRAFQELQKQAVEAERKQVATLRRLSGSASLRRLSARRSDLMDLSQEEIEAGALSETATAANGIRIEGVVSYSIHDRELSVQEEALLREILAVDGELAFQESIIQERESEIRKIEEGMGQVLDVMRELGTLVHEQRAGVDFLHDNILQTRGRIHLAQQEIVKASEHQRRSREKLCYVIMILSIVAAIVMLAFVST